MAVPATPRLIVFLVYDGVTLLDVAGPAEVFKEANRCGADYRIALVSPTGDAVTSNLGFQISVDGAVGELEPDTYLVPGSDRYPRTPVPGDLADAARVPAAKARRIASICTGAFILAAAGLLAGKRATTHWKVTRELAARCPTCHVEPDAIYVRDGSTYSSAGITAGIDLALALIEEDLGAEVARQTAQQLVVHHRRPGGQSQFSALLEMGGMHGRFGALMDWARARLAEPLSVEQLAEQAAMSPRHFARAFAAEVGVTPAKAVERLRLEAARLRVETTREPIDRVAETSGFGDPERMRRAFLRVFGQPPQALRRAARA
jgi:transcriptional regulator GlxA family with amidase domain